METKTAEQPKSEVALRTLASDEEALSSGSQTPTPKIITADLVRANGAEEENNHGETKPAAGKGRQIIMLIILLVILAIGYFYIYPMVREALAPSVI